MYLIVIGGFGGFVFKDVYVVNKVGYINVLWVFVDVGWGIDLFD